MYFDGADMSPAALRHTRDRDIDRVYPVYRAYDAHYKQKYIRPLKELCFIYFFVFVIPVTAFQQIDTAPAAP